MSITTIRDSIETALDTVTGLTVTPDVISLKVKLTDLPAACVVFDSADDVTVNTQSVELKATFRVPVMFSLNDPAAYVVSIETIVLGIYKALSAVTDTGGLVFVRDGGEPEVIDNGASTLLVRKTLYVDADLTEAL